jgi:hypothetical protein
MQLLAVSAYVLQASKPLALTCGRLDESLDLVPVNSNQLWRISLTLVTNNIELSCTLLIQSFASAGR